MALVAGSVASFAAGPLASANTTLYWTPDLVGPTPTGGTGTWSTVSLQWLTAPVGGSFQAYPVAGDVDDHDGGLPRDRAR